MSLVPIRVDSRYCVREQLSSGTFASIYKVVNIFTSKPYAIKLELSMTGKSSVELEYKVLQDLNSGCGIPCTHWFGREANYDALVLDLLGPLLHDLLNKHKKFHLHMISRLQYIHSNGYIHGDIKLQNILQGLGDEVQTIFIIDFGIARNHVPFRHTCSVTSTPAFTSINSHLGAELGHHDNLESLAYFSLPWLNRSSNPCSMLILGLKQKTPLATFLTYEPNYGYM
ncbi:putative casein kinase i alpha [Pisolithus marmoratus]|nr:putative casein kinase i alpha [Pisolithus marmoratus]